MNSLPTSMKEAKEKYTTFFIELYTFHLRTGMTFVAACDEDIYFNGVLYVAVPFVRGEARSSIDEISGELDVQLGDVNDEHLAYIMNGFDFRGCYVDICRIQYPESLSDPNLVQYLYRGYIDSPSFENGVFSFTLRNMFPSMEAPQRSYGITCNSDFGDEICQRDKGSVTATIQAVDGTLITTDFHAQDGYWKNGRAKINGESRNIFASDGNNIHVHMTFLQSDLVGQQILLEKGCDKTQEDCRRHGNLHRFTGFPAIPFESAYR